MRLCSVAKVLGGKTLSGNGPSNPLEESGYHRVKLKMKFKIGAAGLMAGKARSLDFVRLHLPALGMTGF